MNATDFPARFYTVKPDGVYVVNSYSERVYNMANLEGVLLENAALGTLLDRDTVLLARRSGRSILDRRMKESRVMLRVRHVNGEQCVADMRGQPMHVVWTPPEGTVLHYSFLECNCTMHMFLEDEKHVFYSLPLPNMYNYGMCCLGHNPVNGATGLVEWANALFKMWEETPSGEDLAPQRTVLEEMWRWKTSDMSYVPQPEWKKYCVKVANEVTNLILEAWRTTNE